MAGNSPHHDGPTAVRPISRFRRGLAAMLGLAMAVTPVAATLTVGEASAAPGDETVISVTGDFGWNNPGALADHGDLVKGLNPDYVLTTGDNVQTVIPAEGTNKYDFTVGRNFCDFLAGAAPGPLCPSGGTSPINRFFAAPGNHDHMEGDGGGPISNYTDYFDLPGIGAVNPTPSGSELYYDVVLGDVHVFVLDTDPMLLEQVHGETDIPGYGAGVSPTAVQRAWLETAIAGSTARWKVVALHHSPYSSAPVEVGSGYGSATWIQWPFDDWGIDAVLSGHHHAYERLAIDGVQYVTNGMGGDYPRAFAGSPVDGSVVRYNAENQMVVGRLAATDTSLVWEAHNLAGDVIDRFTIGAEAPTAVAAASPTSGVAPLAVALDGSASTNPSGGELTYSWDTNGDGTFGDVTGVNPSVTFTEPGTYAVRLQVTNGGGVSSLSNVVTVNVAPNNGPTPTTSPAISGEAVVGSTLTATPGTWSGDTTTGPSIQWQRCQPGTGPIYADTVGAADPVLHWRLGENGGTTAADASGNGQTGTYAGTLDLTEAGALTGDPDSAVLMNANNASDGLVQRANVAGMPTTAFSADMWVRTTNSSRDGAMVSYAVEGSPDEFHLIDPKALRVSIIGTRVDTGIKLNTGNWHHVAVTWTSEGGSLRVYVDGALRFSAEGIRAGVPMTAGGTLVLGQDQDVLGGGFDSVQAYAGRLDEVAIYPGVLTPGQVESHHDAGNGVSCANVPGATGTTYELGEADLGSRMRVRVTAGNSFGSTTARSATTVVVQDTSSPHPFGVLDPSRGPLAGQVRVAGWAADPDAPTTPLTVRVVIGGPAGTPGAQVALVPANKLRAEVEDEYPGYGTQHGFASTMTTAKRGAQEVCVYAVNIGPGADTLLGCQTETVHDPVPFGHYERATSPRSGQLSVRGWTIDRSTPTDPIRVQITIGGPRGTRDAESHVILADRPRSDVARSYPGTGSNHGFDATISTGKSGEQTVCAYALNVGVGQDKLLGCKQVDIVK